MKTGLEEALAECLASVERGGSVEECLARYPALARELEPLLRTALGLQQAYDVGPDPSFQRAARQRFLAAAARRSRRPLAVAPPPRRFSFGWRWVPAAVGTAALVAAVALAGVLALTGGSGSPDGRLVFETVVPATTPAPATETPVTPAPADIPQLVARAQEQLVQIQTQVKQGAVLQPPEVHQLRDATQSLAEKIQEPAAVPEEEAPRVKDLLASQRQVLTQAKEQNQVAPEAADDVDEVIRIAGMVLEVLAPTATPTPASTETPASTATAAPEASATPTETPASSPEPGAVGNETIVPLTPTPGP
jgi:hypothetical protein